MTTPMAKPEGRSRGMTRLGLAASLLVAVGLALAARSLVLGLTLSSPVPSYDGWAFVDNLRALRAGEYGLSDLFSQHNEHRIFTARLNFFLDYTVFHLGNLSVVVANYLLLGLLAAVLARLGSRGHPVMTRLAAAALALAALWSAAGWINLVWSFQIQWAYVHLLPVLAIVSLVAATSAFGVRRWAWLAAACLCDGLAVYSMSSGLMTIVPLVAVAAWRRASPGLLAVLVAVHLGLVALFFQDYLFPPHRLVVSPVALLRYLAPLFGTAFPASKAVSIDTGALGLVLAAAALAWASWVALVRRSPIEAGTAALLGTVAFALAEGVLTAFGRAGLPDPTHFALRYSTPAELMWTALGLCAWRRLAATGRRGAARGLAALAVCAVAASNLVGGTAAAWKIWSLQNDNEGFNLINGVKTDDRGQGIVRLHDGVQEQVDLLRQLQLGPFAEGESRFRAPFNSLSGTTLASLPACAGAVDQFSVRNGSVAHVQGWAVTPGVPVSSIWALAFARDGRLLGYARTWQRRRDDRHLSGGDAALGYDYWFRLPVPWVEQEVDVVAVFPGHTVPPCRTVLPRPEAVSVQEAPSD